MSAPAVPDSGEWASLDRTLDRYLRHVSIERGLSGNTVAAYRRDLTGYLRFLAARAITVPDGIRKPDLAAFATALRSRPEGGLAASSLARTLSSVRGFHRFLLDEGLVGADVAADTKPPKIPSRLPKAITIEQMSALLAAADGEDIRSLRDRALLELLYATGARVSEAVALDVDDVRAVHDDAGGDNAGGPDGGTVDTVRLTGKGGKTRIVPLGRYARAAIDAYLVRGRPDLATRGAGTPALFLGLRGGRLSRQNVWLIVQARAQRAHLGMDISPHTFRHSFATHLLEGGADVRVVQELLGHSSVATTQIYTLVTADTLRDMYTTAHPRAR
jgi:integrase/recombinase XerD